MLMQDVEKSYHRAYRNAPTVMKIIKETNREKKGVSLFVNQTLANFKENSREVGAELH